MAALSAAPGLAGLLCFDCRSPWSKFWKLCQRCRGSAGAVTFPLKR